MNSIASLVALLQFADQLDTDFKAATGSLTASDKTIHLARLTALLSDAKADLAAVTKKLIGHEIGGGQDIIPPPA